MNLTQVTIISTTLGKNPLEEMEQPSVNKRVQTAVLGCSPKNDRTICLFPKQIIQYHSNRVSAPTTKAEKAEAEWFYDDLQDVLQLTPKTDVLFITGDWNTNIGSQEIPGVRGKFGLGIENDAGKRLTRVLPRGCTGHSKHPLQTTQETTLHMNITRWLTTKSD